MTTVKHVAVNVRCPATMRIILVFGMLLLLLSPTQASDSIIVMKKSIQDYANAMSDVQSSLEEKGFKVKFVQRVDIGLAKAGYHSDKYRIVFFMPKHGMAGVLSKRADLADMFPFKVTVYRENGKVYVFCVQTTSLLDSAVPTDIRALFQSWDKQIDGVVRNVF